MKRVAATFLCIGAIALYTVFSFGYISDFADDMEAEIFTAQKENYTAENIEDIKECAAESRKVLLFIANKEHISDMENALAGLEFAAQHKNVQDIKTYEKMLLNTLEEIKTASHTLY